MPSRTEVFSALDSERAYQDARWGPERGHSPEEWLLYMQDYLTEAIHIVTRTAEPEGVRLVMHHIRKITALGVVAMEEHGAPRREGF